MLYYIRKKRLHCHDIVRNVKTNKIVAGKGEKSIMAARKVQPWSA